MEVCSRNGLDPKTVLLKINGASCNLNCIYCSEIKKKLKRQIPLDQIEYILKQLPLDTAVILHGGEPLLDFEYFKKVFSAFKQVNFKYKLSLQTNGVLDIEAINFLCKDHEDINIGISIDGPRKQNSFRTNNNEPVFDQVVRTMRLFEERGINLKCIATVNSISADSPAETLDFFMSFKNIKQLRFNPCFDCTKGTLNKYSVHPLVFLDFLHKLSIRWINDRLYKEIRLDPLQSTAERIINNDIRYYYPCNNYISIYSDDKCTFCDALGDEHFIVHDYSNIFNLNNQNKKFKCSSCHDYPLCGGGCNAIMARFAQNESLLIDYCQYRKGLARIIRDITKT
jgi:uncharacterized protein